MSTSTNVTQHLFARLVNLAAAIIWWPVMCVISLDQLVGRPIDVTFDEYISMVVLLGAIHIYSNAE